MSTPIKRTDQDIVDLIKKAIIEGKFIPTDHAEEKMTIRKVQLSDIEEMIQQCHREHHKDELTNDTKDWKYVVRGLNKEADKDIRIAVVFKRHGVAIITVIDKNKKED